MHIFSFILIFVKGILQNLTDSLHNSTKFYTMSLILFLNTIRCQIQCLFVFKRKTLGVNLVFFIWCEISHKPGSVLSNHLSRLTVTSKLKRHTTWRDGQSHNAITRSCSRWGLHSDDVTTMLVSSYLAFPPLPKNLGGISLLHYPSSHPDWTLSSTLPYGAPTFLS